PGIESMVGLFVNTLPIRVHVDPRAALMTWLRELQQQLVDAREFEYSPLVDVHGWSEIPRGTPLFESAIVVQNTPKITTDKDMALRMQPVRSFGTHNLAIQLTVNPGRRTRLELNFDSRRFDQESIDRLLTHV